MASQITAVGGPPLTRDNSGWCVLALDGGGVKGLSSLYIVRTLMDRVNKERDKRGELSVKPCELFDMICGTSTGGLIAVMLGRLEMTIDECIDCYNSMCKRIFENEGRKFALAPKSWNPFKLGKDDVKVKAAFDAHILTKCILEIIASRTPGTDNAHAAEVRLNDGVDRDCKVFVCATKRTPSESTVRFRSYDSPSDDFIGKDATILQACRATSAAPTFFDPINIGGVDFFDGGLGANNPSIEAWQEIRDLSQKHGDELEASIACFISVGCGETGWSKIEDSLVEFLRKSLGELATEVNKTAKRFHQDHSQLFAKKRCSRFNVEQGMQNVGLEEWEKLDDIKNAAEEYITNPETSDKTRAVVEWLSQKQFSVDPFHPLVDARDIEALKNSLFFEEYRQRLDDIAPVDDGTFDSAFAEICNVMGTRLTFSEWAAQPSPVLWVCGKAGSGKSTMLKKMIDSRHAPWAQNDRFRLLSFFGWRPAASRLQKTLEGALKSLLYQLINTDPSLIAPLLLVNGVTGGRAPAWTEQTLTSGLLALSGHITSWRPCFCIDGLDELQDSDGHGLSEVLLLVQQRCAAVLILSSRSNLQLDKIFRSCKSLDLSLYNRQDIEDHVRKKLPITDEENFLPEAIANRAEGVFLWAVLVTENIRKGTLFARDKLGDYNYIREELRKIPQDIGKLIINLLNRAKDISADVEHYRKDLRFYLRVMQLSTDGKVSTPSVALFTATEWSVPLTNYQQFVKDCHETSSRIAALSCGLLWVKQVEWAEDRTEAWAIPQPHHAKPGNCIRRSIVPLDGSVRDFMRILKTEICWLHRSAYDFLLENDLDASLGLTEAVSDQDIITKILRAQRSLFVSSPCPVIGEPSLRYSKDTAATRLQDIVHFIPSTWSYRERELHLNALKNDLSAFTPKEMRLHSDLDKFNPVTAPDSLHSDLHVELPFWSACVFEACCDYVCLNLALINRFDDVGWLPARLLELCYPNDYTYRGQKYEIDDHSLRYLGGFADPVVKMVSTLLKALKSKMESFLNQMSPCSRSLYDGCREFVSSTYPYTPYERTWYSTISEGSQSENFNSTVKPLCSTWVSLCSYIEYTWPKDSEIPWPPQSVIEIMIDLVQFFDHAGVHFETGGEVNFSYSVKQPGRDRYILSLQVSAAGLPGRNLRHKLFRSSYRLKEPWKTFLELQPTFWIVGHDEEAWPSERTYTNWRPFMKASAQGSGGIVWNVPKGSRAGDWIVKIPSVTRADFSPYTEVYLHELIGVVPLKRLLDDKSFRDKLFTEVNTNRDGKLGANEQRQLKDCIWPNWNTWPMVVKEHVPQDIFTARRMDEWRS